MQDNKWTPGRITCLVIALIAIFIAGFPWTLLAGVIIAGYSLINYTLKRIEQRNQQNHEVEK